MRSFALTLAALLALGGTAVESQARSKAYCRAYARDVAAAPSAAR
jgi:hypothetical protein